MLAHDGDLKKESPQDRHGSLSPRPLRPRRRRSQTPPGRRLRRAARAGRAPLRARARRARRRRHARAARRVEALAPRRLHLPGGRQGGRGRHLGQVRGRAAPRRDRHRHAGHRSRAHSWWSEAEPGTAKSWLSEHLAAAISGRLADARAGHGRHHGGAGPLQLELRLAARRGAVAAGAGAPRPCTAGWPRKIVRFEEITRSPSEVQDALITLLSEKVLTVPGAGDHTSRARSAASA